MLKMIRLLALCTLAICLNRAGSAQNISLKPYSAAINVSNIDSSIKWYSQTLHLTLRNRVDNKERGFKQAILINKDIMIELVELVRSVSTDSLLQQQPQGTASRGYRKVGFTVSNIDAWFQQVSASNVKLFGRMITDPVDKKKTFLVKDPDDNLIQFFEE